jgi:signal transduction histidine kinase
MASTTVSRDGVLGRPALWSPSSAPRLFLAGGAAAIALYFTLPPAQQSIAYVGIGFAAVVAIFAGALLRPPAVRVPWYLFACGFLCEIGGDAVFTIYELGLGREPPMPSTADALYLAGYPLIALGIVLLVRQLGGQTSRVAQLDMAIVFVAVATVQWVFFAGSYVGESLADGAQLVSMAYPSMGVLLLVGFVQLIVGPAKRSATYWLLVASVVLWVTADEIYGLTIDTYVSGSWIDGLWLGSYVIWAVAALGVSSDEVLLRDQRVVPRLTSARVGMLGAALLAAPVAAVVERAMHHRIHVVAEAIGATTIAVLVLVRLTGLLKAVERARTDERLAREQAEEMQRRFADQNERLVELDRLKDEFVSSVSHELRTPLTSICGYAELLLEDVKEEQTRGYVKIVERNAGRLLELVNDLLFAASLQAGGLELRRGPIDLRALVEETVASAARQAESAEVELRVRAEDGLPAIDGDGARLSQVVTNFVSNAIKFTPAGGRVDIAVCRQNGHVLLEVSDTGIGIPEEELGHLFERFFRAQTALERHIPGTGLGLYISKAIVDAHGGRVAVRSVVGKGTTFALELPVRDSEAAA